MHWIALQTPPEAEPHSADGGVLVDAAAAIGWWALQFTPRVARVGPAVVFEVSGSDRLFGGREPLVEQIIRASLPLGALRSAQAGTSLQALAQLQIDPVDYQEPDRLPLHTLPAAREHLPTLQRLGCTVWGDVRALPRGGVVRRFGADLLDALDRAYGLKPEVYPWLEMPDVFDMPLELFAQVEAAPALLFAARRLLLQLQAWLQARQRGILALVLEWQMDARRHTAAQGQLVLRTAQPTRDMAHLQRLLAEHLARTTLAAPVLYLRLRSLETAPLPDASASLLPDDVLAGDSLHQLLERLSARLGPQQVLRAMPQADHRPENMLAWLPAGAGSGTAQPAPAPTSPKRKARSVPATPAQAEASLYPTWLLHTPLLLALQNNRPLYQGPLVLLAGPQRLEAAWWDVAGVSPERAHAGKPLAVLRDYFLARSAQAGLLWIYRERLTTREQGVEAAARANAASRWYLHGLFG